MSRLAFAGKLFPYLNTLERIFLVGFIIGVVLRISHTPGGDEILMISMSSLAIICFLFAHKPLPGNPGSGFNAWLASIVHKVFYLGSSICIIGLLFFFLHFAGYQQMLLIGGSTIGSCTLISLYLLSQVNEISSVLQPAILRGLPLGIAAAFVLYYYGLS